MLVGISTHSIECHHFQWPWLTQTTWNHSISGTSRHYNDSWTDWAPFFAQGLHSAYPTQCLNGIRISPKIMVLPCRTFPKLWTRKFCNCAWIISGTVTPRGAGVPPFRLCSSLVHSLPHLLLFITFFLFSSTLLIFFYCPSDPFLPE